MTSSEHTSTSAAATETSAAATETSAAATPTAETADAGGGLPTGGAGPAGGPVPGDPSTEPVATAAQSHVKGRVGPPSIAQDSDAVWHTPDGVDQIAPGEVRPPETAIESAPIPQAFVDPATLGAGPYGGETPPDEAPNVVHETKPGTEAPGADELPANTPLPGDKASASSLTGTGVDAGSTSTTADTASPTSPTAGPSSSSSSGGDATSAPSPSDPATDAGSSGSSGGGSAGAGTTSSTSGTSSDPA